MTNQEYFIDDCKSCKYLLGAEGCVAINDHDDSCTYCKNKDKYSICNCLRRPDMTLEHCPYWRDLDDA